MFEAGNGRVLQRRVMYKPRKSIPAFPECRGVSSPLRARFLRLGVARHQGGCCTAEGCTSAGRAVDNLPKRGPSRRRSGRRSISEPVVPSAGPLAACFAYRRPQKHRKRYLRLCTAINISCNATRIPLVGAILVKEQAATAAMEAGRAKRKLGAPSARCAPGTSASSERARTTMARVPRTNNIQLRIQRAMRSASDDSYDAPKTLQKPRTALVLASAGWRMDANLVEQSCCGSRNVNCGGTLLFFQILTNTEWRCGACLSALQTSLRSCYFQWG